MGTPRRALPTNLARRITELLLEVDRWTGFSRHFTHLKSGEPALEPRLLLTAVQADGINLGLSKMAEACPEASHAKLSRLAAWHIRDETYAKGLAELVNAQRPTSAAAFPDLGWGLHIILGRSALQGWRPWGAWRASEPEIRHRPVGHGLHPHSGSVSPVLQPGHQRHGQGCHLCPGRPARP